MNFIAIKLHFQSNSYDYFRYSGKTRANWSSFEKFSGKRTLHNILKSHQTDFIEFVATGFAYDNNVSWVGDFSGDSIDQHWRNHRRNMDKLGRLYQNELEQLLEKGSIKDALISKDDLPLIEKNRINGLTSMETCVILDHIFDYINRNNCSHPLWERTKVIKKYSPFLKINIKKFIDITGEML